MNSFCKWSVIRAQLCIQHNTLTSCNMNYSMRTIISDCFTVAFVWSPASLPILTPDITFWDHFLDHWLWTPEIGCDVVKTPEGQQIVRYHLTTKPPFLPLSDALFELQQVILTRPKRFELRPCDWLLGYLCKKVTNKDMCEYRCIGMGCKKWPTII